MKKWFLTWIIIAWFCESIMDTIDHHQHSSWLFKINWPDNVMIWWKSEWINRDKFLLNLYDAWHTFKGLMLIFQSFAIWSLSKWYYALIFLLSYFLIHEFFYGYIFIIGG